MGQQRHVPRRASGDDHRGIYKPLRGERPLWDFEPGLHKREVAAYELSQAMGIGAVPPTILRHDGPLGEGSIQWFVDADHREHYFTIAEHRPDLHDQLRAIAVLDVIANNTDRKSGHCLLAPGWADAEPSERVWAIDNGLCFATDFKLRTVIWEFAGESLSDALVAAVLRAGRVASPPRSPSCSTTTRWMPCAGGRPGWPSTASSRATTAATGTPGRLFDDRRRPTTTTSSTS